LLCVVYVDDIISTDGVAQGIAYLNYYLQFHFQIKNLGCLWYLGTEVVRFRK